MGSDVEQDVRQAKAIVCIGRNITNMDAMGGSMEEIARDSALI